MAWLNCTPKGEHKSRREQIEVLAESQGCDPDYQLPNIDDAELFTSTLSSIGEAKVSSSGLASIEWSDIVAWMQATRAMLSPGEAEAIKYLSSCYVSQYYQSMEKGALSPHMESPPNREQVAGKMKTLFAMLRG